MNIYNIRNQIVIMLFWKLKLKDSSSNHKRLKKGKKDKKKNSEWAMKLVIEVLRYLFQKYGKMQSMSQHSHMYTLPVILGI